MKTTIFVFNENGIIDPSRLESFCIAFYEKSKIGFVMQSKSDIDPTSTIFSKFATKDLEFIIYDYGYVMKIEGDIKKTILLLKEIDNSISDNVSFYVSPSQRIENSDEFKFPRGVNEKDISCFLDELFNNKHYSSSLRDN